MLISDEAQLAHVAYRLAQKSVSLGVNRACALHHRASNLSAEALCICSHRHAVSDPFCATSVPVDCDLRTPRQIASCASRASEEISLSCNFTYIHG